GSFHSFVILHQFGHHFPNLPHEVLGLIIAVLAMFAGIALTLFAVRNAAQGRSTFYDIAGCAAVSLLMVQMGLNVFGSLDILPFTGVTFPFVSMGGSSMLSCWGLLAYLQAAAPPPVSVKAAPKAPAPAVKPPQATGFLDELGVATDDIFGKEDAR
ncbi:MAG: FtsW/RodA/SpoVE family cell cycle protein, partial [Oscillospiraceae bacterium]